MRKELSRRPVLRVRHRPRPEFEVPSPRRSQECRSGTLPRRDRAHPEPVRSSRRGSAFPGRRGAPPIAELGRPLLDRLDLRQLVVTCGPQGLVALSRAGSEWVTGEARHVSDVTGAGDTVAAVLALALGAGADVERDASPTWRASSSARSAPPPSGRPEARCASASTREGKVLTRDELTDSLERWRSAGRSVTFTNGCFDLLHAGHLTLLREAAQCGDVLVVGLNGDRSATRLKGPGGRSFRKLLGRPCSLPLDCVTAVVVFDGSPRAGARRAIRTEALVARARITRWTRSSAARWWRRRAGR